jgi:hypothetical protein
MKGSKIDTNEEILNYEPFTIYYSPFIKNLHFDPEAKISYELLSGGLTWSDELADLKKVELGHQDNFVMHALWAYRTSLIKEKPRYELKEIWEQVKKNYPNWPGFQKERISPKLLAPLEKFENDY